jgi:hypothetical protein
MEFLHAAAIVLVPGLRSPTMRAEWNDQGRGLVGRRLTGLPFTNT